MNKPVPRVFRDKADRIQEQALSPCRPKGCQSHNEPFRRGYRQAVDDMLPLTAQADALVHDMADELNELLDWIKTGDYHQSFVENAEQLVARYKELQNESEKDPD